MNACDGMCTRCPAAEALGGGDRALWLRGCLDGVDVEVTALRVARVRGEQAFEHEQDLGRSPLR
jgi:hypothetical protein